MTAQQKRAATGLSLLIVAVAAAFFTWLAIDVSSGTAGGETAPGREFMAATANWGGLATALKLLPVVVSLGLAFLGRYHLKDWLFYAILGVSVVGAAATLYLFLELSTSEVAKAFWQHALVDSIQDPESFASAAQKGLGATLAWFVAAIVTQLGIKTSGPS
jgi:hypothetical protein